MLLTEKNIAPTKNTPEVVLDPGGIILIKGRSSNKNPLEFYTEIENWIDEYIQNPPDITRIHIHLEYFNDVNSTIFRSLLRKISNVRLKEKQFVVNWYYEEDDDDILERGEHLSLMLNIPIYFITITGSDNALY
jgi:hypothetical protein